MYISVQSSSIKYSSIHCCLSRFASRLVPTRYQHALRRERFRREDKKNGEKVRKVTMPRVPMSLFLRLLRVDGRGRRFQHRVRDLRRFRRGGWNQRRQDLRRNHRNGAGPSKSNQPVQPDVPARLLAGPAAPRLEADGGIDPALAAPPPPVWCSVHGWVVCPLHQYNLDVRTEPVVEEAAPPLLPSPTPRSSRSPPATRWPLAPPTTGLLMPKHRVYRP